MVGAMALATKDVPDFTVSVGIPARPVRAKDRPCPYCEKEGAGALTVGRRRARRRSGG